MPRKKNETTDRWEDPFPTRLRLLMHRNKVTSQMLGDYLGIARQSANAYCNGSAYPNLDSLIKIAKYFNVTSDYLLGLSDVQSPDADLQGVCAYTGLTEDAALTLKTWSSAGPDGCTFSEALSKIIVTDNAFLAISDLCPAIVRNKEIQPEKKPVKDYFESEAEYCQLLQPIFEKGLSIITPDGHVQFCLFNAKQRFSNAIDQIFENDSEA